MHFRFESLLKLRKNRESLVQKEFGIIQRHMLTQMERHDSLEQAENSGKREFDRRLNLGMDVNSRILFDNYFTGLKHQTAVQDTVVMEAECKLETKRKELGEAVKKRKTLDILKDRDFFLSRKRASKLETDYLDEAAAAHWRRTT